MSGVLAAGSSTVSSSVPSICSWMGNCGRCSARRERTARSVFGLRRGDARFDVQTAERVNVRAGYVGIGRMILDCRTASRWAPTRWARPAMGLAARLATVELAARRRAWDESAGMAGDVTDALRGSDAELARAVQRTVGRGPGLTPAGDDVLVGILALLTSGAAGAAGERATVATRQCHASRAARDLGCQPPPVAPSSARPSGSGTA